MKKERGERTFKKKQSKIIFWIAIGVGIILLGLVLLKYYLVKSSNEILKIEEREAIENVRNLANEDKTALIIFGNHKEFEIKRGKSSNILVIFKPEKIDAWGNGNKGCKYNIEVLETSLKDSCLAKGFVNPLDLIESSVKDAYFEEIRGDGLGSSLVKISAPKNTKPCTEVFKLSVNCEEYPEETIESSFTLKIIRRKLF